MGLFDQLELYKGLIKNYNVDYVILYITENDFENNFAVSQKTKVFNQPKFFVDKNSQNVIKIDRDYSKLNEQYFSKFNKFKRSKIILYFKEYSYTFKTYFHIKTLIHNYKDLKIN